MLNFENSIIRIESAGESHTIDLTQMEPDEEGYVLTSSETYDPPTKPLDKNGQGIPYAQFGYAGHLAVVTVDICG